MLPGQNSSLLTNTIPTRECVWHFHSLTLGLFVAALSDSQYTWYRVEAGEEFETHS